MADGRSRLSGYQYKKRSKGCWAKKASRCIRVSHTIDAESQRIIKSQRKHWNGILLRIASIIKMLTKHNLAFQGTSDNLYFFKLVELLAEFNPLCGNMYAEF